MIDAYGRESVEEMLNNKETYKISTPEIIEMIEFYEKQVENLMHERWTTE